MKTVPLNSTTTTSEWYEMYIRLPAVIDQYPDETWLRSNGFKKARHLRMKIASKCARKIWMRTRLAEAQNWKCAWCGCGCVHEKGYPNSTTIEHVIPKSKGGADEWENLTMACYNCNGKRATKPVEQFMQEVRDTYKMKNVSEST